MTPPEPSLTAQARLELLADHYRESFAHQRDYGHRRDRLFLYALLAAVALAFRVSYADTSERVLAIAVDRLLGAGAGVDRSFLAVLLWFVFFALVIRYFQATVTVERNYKYLACLEEEISTLYGSDVFSRESKNYLARYPKFSDWMNVVYTGLFPLGVAAVVVWNVIAEVDRSSLSMPGTVTVVAIAAATVVSVGLYLYSMKLEHRRPSPPAEASAGKTSAHAPSGATAPPSTK